MNSLNLTGVSFFWIWAKCQARKMTTSSDIHSMTVLNVAFTRFGLRTAPRPSLPLPAGRRNHHLSLPLRRRLSAAGRGMVPM